MWEIVSTTCFKQWFEGLDEVAQDEVRYSIGLLSRGGPSLGRPYADTLKGSRFPNMKELRVTAKKIVIRVAFAFDPARKAVLLVAGDKRGVNQTRFYRQLIARADTLYAEHLTR